MKRVEESVLKWFGHMEIMFKSASSECGRQYEERKITERWRDEVRNWRWGVK